MDIILGCMFSGKSTEMLRRVSRYKAIGKKCLIINSALDTRSVGLITHGGVTENDVIKVGRLSELKDSPKFLEAEIIAIDEAQFFTDLREFCLICESLGKRLIVAGLDGDSNREPFGEILTCIPLCDTVVKLSAMDMILKDGTPGIFSKRIARNKNTQVHVGGKDSYLAVSRKSYLTK